MCYSENVQGARWRTLDKVVGARIARLRKMHADGRLRERAISQQELADLLGVSRSHVANLENGRQRITLGAVFAVCEALSEDTRDVIPSMDEFERELAEASRRQTVVHVKFGGKEHEVDSDLMDALSSALDMEVTDVAE